MKLKEAVEVDTRTSVSELTDMISTSKSIISAYLNILGKKKTENKTLSDMHLIRNERNHQIVTCSEKWILCDNRKRWVQ